MKSAARIENLMGMLEKEPDDLFLNYALGLEYANDLSKVADAESQFKIVLSLDQNYIPRLLSIGSVVCFIASHTGSPGIL